MARSRPSFWTSPAKTSRVKRDDETPGTMSLTAEDVAALEAGATLLSSGGGGDTAVPALLLSTLLGEVAICRASEMPRDSLVVHVGLVGSGDILNERLVALQDLVLAVEAVVKHLGEPLAAIGVTEMAGFNGLIAFAAAHALSVPVVDSDLMARAYPSLTQTTLVAAGASPAPLTLVGPGGATVLLSNCTPSTLDALVLACAATMGGLAASAMYPVHAGVLAEHGITGSVSACLELGRTYRALQTAELPVLADALGFSRMYEGVVQQVHPRDASHVGSITLDTGGTQPPLRIDFADEFIAMTEGGELVAASPEVIIAMDPVTRAALHPEQLRVGQAVVFASMPSLHDWSAASLDLVGPRGYGVNYERDVT